MAVRTCCRVGGKEGGGPTGGGRRRAERGGPGGGGAEADPARESGGRAAAGAALEGGPAGLLRLGWVAAACGARQDVPVGCCTGDLLRGVLLRGCKA